jgi:D-sedoheptulose 7-phosphate isomerase
MLMLEQRIAQHFYESADLQSQSAAALSKPIALAAHMLLGCVTSGGKVVFFGHDGSAPLAALGASLLTGRLERDRLPLAGLSLNAVADAAQAPEQLRALGMPGDVLVLVCAADRAPAINALMRAASDKEIGVIALTGPTHPDMEANLTDTDVHIAVAHERRMRVFETHAVALHALIDTLDVQLLGEQEPT